LAIEKFIEHPACAIVVDGLTVRIERDVVLEAPKAASYLSDVPNEQRLTAVEDLLDQGAAAMSMVRASAHVVVLERRVADLTAALAQGLEEQLREAGVDQATLTRKLLDDHRAELTKLLVPLSDPNLKDGLPTRMVELLEMSHRRAQEQLLAMLQDSDEGVVAQAVKRIVSQVKESEAQLAKQFAAREALLTRSNLRGRQFEDVLSVRLPMIARGIGRVEHCASIGGARDRNVGDYLVTLESGGRSEEIRLVIEAKSQKSRLSTNEIRSQLREGRLNRKAAAGILIASGASALPDGIGFGQVSDCDFYAAFDVEAGDETALSCALYMARAVAVSSVLVNTPAGIDRGVIQREVGLVFGLMQQFATIEASHTRAEKAIGAARSTTDSLRADIVAALHRLETALQV
jgi:hypothetical protein